MARLPSERYVIQQAGGIVRLAEDHTEDLITAFDPADGLAVESALAVIRSSRLSDEDKCFACFWAGYFHAHADRDPEVPRERYVFESGGAVIVTALGHELVSFRPGNADAAARAQKVIYDSPLGPGEQARAHFWSGFFYGQARRAHTGKNTEQETRS
jgi:hypothetical protein